MNVVTKVKSSDKTTECKPTMQSADVKNGSAAISQQCDTDCLHGDQLSLSRHSVGHVTSVADRRRSPAIRSEFVSGMVSDPSRHQLLPCRAASGAARDWLFARRRREISRGAGQGDNTDKRGHDLCVRGRATTRSIKARCIVAERRDDASRSVVRRCPLCRFHHSFIHAVRHSLRWLSRCNNTATYYHQYQLVITVDDLRNISQHYVKFYFTWRFSKCHIHESSSNTLS